MKRRISLLVVSAILVASPGFISPTAQQPAPAPQVAPQVALAPAVQKPTPAPPPPPPPTNPTGAKEQVNVRVDVTIRDDAGLKASAITKMMSIVVSRNGSLRSGVNVPLPSTVFATGEKSPQPQGTPVTSYNYRNMGLSLDVSNVYIQNNGLIHLRISVEYNPVDEAEKTDRPVGMPVSYSTFSQGFELDLANGKPLLVAQTSDPVPSRNRTLSVEVKATILR